MVKIKLCMAIHNSPLGERVQVFGPTISGIDWVDKRYPYDWLMVALNTIDQSRQTLVHPKRSRNHCAQGLYPFSLENGEC